MVGNAITTWEYHLHLFFTIDNIQLPEDDQLWIIVGDIPSMYLDVNSLKTTKQVLECHADLADHWANTVLEKGDLSDCFPFDNKGSKKEANMLLSIVGYINSDIIPNMPIVAL